MSATERALALLVPGSIRTRTGGTIYDRRISEGLRARGWSVTVHALATSFPTPDRAAVDHAATLLQELPRGALTLVDGLAFGALPDLARTHAPRLELIALVHHPLADETGLGVALARELEQRERRALAAARHVIATSRATARALCERYAVREHHLSVVEPGTDPAPFATGSSGAGVTLLCVGTLTPRKGHDLLLRALAAVRGPWRLLCAGSAERDPDWARTVRRLMAELELEDRIELLGELDTESLRRRYLESDVFVLPTHLEGYGMALAEAVAHGLPVVSTRAGAVPDTVGEEASILVPAGDLTALTTALQRVIAEPDLRARLARGARARAARLPTWDAAAQVMSRVLEALRRG